MLLVARRVGEALRIGEDVEVKVVASSRSRVLLAVSAPRELDIRRVYGKSDNKPAAGDAAAFEHAQGEEAIEQTIDSASVSGPGKQSNSK